MIIDCAEINKKRLEDNNKFNVESETNHNVVNKSDNN